MRKKKIFSEFTIMSGADYHSAAEGIFTYPRKKSGDTKKYFQKIKVTGHEEKTVAGLNTGNSAVGNR